MVRAKGTFLEEMLLRRVEHRPLPTKLQGKVVINQGRGGHRCPPISTFCVAMGDRCSLETTRCL